MQFTFKIDKFHFFNFQLEYYNNMKQLSNFLQDKDFNFYLKSELINELSDAKIQIEKTLEFIKEFTGKCDVNNEDFKNLIDSYLSYVNII